MNSKRVSQTELSRMIQFLRDYHEQAREAASYLEGALAHVQLPIDVNDASILLWIPLRHEFLINLAHRSVRNVAPSTASVAGWSWR